MKGAYRLRNSQLKSLALQKYHLDNCTEGVSLFHSNKEFRWLYETKPTSLSRVYKVLIHFQVNKRPRIFVIKPNLNLLTTKEIPHIFATTKDNHFKDATCLCLYKHEWSPHLLFSKTIIPWVDLWLFYFECWLCTGNWEGGGEHPN